MSTAARARSLVSKVMVFPSVRWTRSRRNRIGSCESPLLAKRTSWSSSTGEIVALGGCDKARADVVEAHVGLGPGDEDRALVSDCGPPAVVAIPLVKDIARPRLDRQRATDLGVVNIGIGNVEDARIIGLRVKDDMELQAANAPVRFGPLAQLAERNGGRIDQPYHRRTVVPRLPIQLACQQAEGLSKETTRSPFV